MTSDHNDLPRFQVLPPTPGREEDGWSVFDRRDGWVDTYLTKDEADTLAKDMNEKYDTPFPPP